MSGFDSDDISPGYIELVGSTKRKTKEDLRLQQLIPQAVLENSEGIHNLLKAYYDFMNLQEFIYQDVEDFNSIVLNGRAVFRIPDPENKNNRFFSDEGGENSTLVLTFDNDVVSIPLTAGNVSITNGNELPGSLEGSTTAVGKTLAVTGLQQYNSYTAKLTTIVKNWVPPGPSYAINTIEEAMHIDFTPEDYLELIQKEIAAAIPRNITVNKRNLYKNIVEFYKIRGSSDSIETFFRLLFNDQVTVEFPYDQTLIPSSGAWDPNPQLPRGGQYLDNKGFLSDRIKIQDSLRYQKFSYLIKTGNNLAAWEDIYNRLVHPAGFIFFGEILILIELTRRTITGTTPVTDQHPGGRSRLYSKMPFRNRGVVGFEDLPLLVEMFASIFKPTVFPAIHRTGRLSPNLTNGVLTNITIINSGFGYAGTPNVTFNGVAIEGETLVAPQIELTMGEFGEIVEVTIIDGGSGYENITIVVDANPNSGSLAQAFFIGAQNKVFRTAPTIVFGEPTARDSEGNPLSTNQQAEAVFVLDAEGKITGVNIINAGSGYIVDPGARVLSNAFTAQRAKDIEPILILPLNHKNDLSRTLEKNSYFSLKSKNQLDSSKKFDSNFVISQFSDIEIGDLSITDINKLNVNSFIQIK